MPTNYSKITRRTHFFSSINDHLFANFVWLLLQPSTLGAENCCQTWSEEGQILIWSCISTQHEVYTPQWHFGELYQVLWTTWNYSWHQTALVFHCGPQLYIYGITKECNFKGNKLSTLSTCIAIPSTTTPARTCQMYPKLQLAYIINTSHLS